MRCTVFVPQLGPYSRMTSHTSIYQNGNRIETKNTVTLIWSCAVLYIFSVCYNDQYYGVDIPTDSDDNADATYTSMVTVHSILAITFLLLVISS